MQSLRVLVVDDEPLIRQTVARALARDGTEVAVAADGAEAAAKARETEFDIVLTDFKMPGMNGIEVLKTVKALRPATEVIVITAYGTVENAVEAIRQGALDFVTKPIDLQDLKNKVAEAAERVNLTRSVDLLDSAAEETPVRSGHLVGSSHPMLEVYRLIRKVAASD